MSNISLTASMRSNLLSLQSIARQQGITQNRLASGLRVNSAIDNPLSYYTASSLNNRASDLSALLDSMNQGIQTIRAASDAIAASTRFLEQASATANQVLEGEKSSFVKVSTKDELLRVLKNDNITRIIIEDDITFDDNEQLFVGDGKTIEGANSKVKLKFSSSSVVSYKSAINLGNATIKNLSVEFNRSGVTGNGAAINGGKIEGEVNITNTGNNAYGVLNTNINGTVNISTNGTKAHSVLDSNVNGIANISVSGGGYGVSGSNIYGTANVINRGGAYGIHNSNIYGNINVSTTESPNGYGVYSSNIGASAVVKITSSGRFGTGATNIKTGAELWIASDNNPNMQKYIQATDIGSPNGAVTGVTQVTSDFIAALNEYIVNDIQSDLLAKPVSGSGLNEKITVSTKAELLAALNNKNISHIIIASDITFDDNEQLNVSNGVTIEGANSKVKLKFSSSNNSSVNAITLGHASIKNISVEFNRSALAGSGAAINGGWIEGEVNVTTRGQGAHGVNYSSVNGTANITTNGNNSQGMMDSNINGTVNITISGTNSYGIYGSTINGIANITNLGNAAGIYSGTVSSLAIVKVATISSMPTLDANIKTGAELWLASGNNPNMQKYIQATDATTVNGIISGVSQSSSGFIAALNEYIVNGTQSDLLAKPVKYDGPYDSSAFDAIIAQYDSLIKDASYKGINLLLSQDIRINFNESRSSNLHIKGVDASSKALGIDQATGSLGTQLKNQSMNLD